MRTLATIQKIKKIESIPNKDKIGYASFEDIGFKVICDKTTIKEGDLVVYCEIDSILPIKPEFEFLRNKCYLDKWNGFRISAMKMSGLYSEGIVFPISILPKGKYKVGIDVTNILGIKKYEPNTDNVIETKKQPLFERILKFISLDLYKKYYKRKYKTEIKEYFPKQLAYQTDEARIQNLNKIIDYMNNNEITLTYTEKLDGTSATYIYDKQTHEYIICSRNLVVFKDKIKNIEKYDNIHTKDSIYIEASNKYNILDKLLTLSFKFPEYSSYVIQGEIIGPNIQGNKYELDTIQLWVFNVYIDKEYRKRGTSLFIEELEDLALDINIIPSTILYLPKNTTVDSLLEKAKGNSFINKNTVREGIVIRDYYSKEKITNNLFSFKVINPDFILKYNK